MADQAVVGEAGDIRPVEIRDAVIVAAIEDAEKRRTSPVNESVDLPVITGRGPALALVECCRARSRRSHVLDRRSGAKDV